MDNHQLIERITQIILENTGENLVSLYLIGSFLRGDMVESSDIDLVGIMKSSFDFRKEKLINKILNEKIKSKHKIDLGTMNYDEFFGRKQKGSLMRFIDLPVFLIFFKKWKTYLWEKTEF